MVDGSEHWCRSCLKTLEEGTEGAVSLDGNAYDICGGCWNSMKPFERVILLKGFELLDDTSPGGLGGMFYSLSYMLPKVFEAWHGHSMHQSCRECDGETLDLRDRRRLLAEKEKAKQAEAAKKDQVQSPEKLA